MILEFSVKNFRSIKDKATISFEASSDTNNSDSHIVEIGNKRILKMAMILGPNASGKTNILKALDFFLKFIINSFDTLNPTGRTGVQPFKFDEETLKAPTEFSISFFIEKTRYDYDLKLTRRAVLFEELNYSPKGQTKLLFRRDASKEEPYIWGDSFVGKKKDLADMTRTNLPFLTTAAKLNHKMLKEIYRWFQIKYLPLINPGDPLQVLSVFTSKLIYDEKISKKDILELLKNADLSHISDINIKKEKLNPAVLSLFSELDKKVTSGVSDREIIDTQFIHQYKNSKGVPLQITSESKGTIRFYELCGPLLLAKERGSFLPIDELDTSLHQEVFNMFIKTFLENSNEAQIIFTFHNLDLLETSIIRKDEIWLCKKDDETGGSLYTCLDNFTGIRKGESLRKAYLAGRFGALPITDITRLD